MIKQLKNKRALTKDQQRLLLSTSYDDLLKVFKGYTRSYLTAERRKLIASVDPSDLISVDSERAQSKAKLASLDKGYKAVLAESQMLREDLDNALRMREHLKIGMLSVGNKKQDRHEATAVFQASDWHCEEPVVADNVNGINEYSLDIFDARQKAFFVNSVKLVEKERSAVDINSVVMHFGGDFITGGIHEDTSFKNQLGPMKAILLVQQALANGLRYMLKELPDCNFVIPCSDGNHSRITKRQMIKSEHDNSLEYLMYHNLAFNFENEPRVRFALSGSYLTYVKIQNRVCRFHHGHAIEYKGGMGGLTIPVLKKIAYWNKACTAYLDYFGHFHQRLNGGSFLANGSMIGYNEYALRIGASPEPPQQQMSLIDSEHGLTVVAPVHMSI